MMNKRWLVVIIALVLILASTSAVLALKPFKIDNYVTDQAGILAESEAAQLASALDQYHQATGNQLLVVTIPSLEGADLTGFTEELFTLNKPGEKGKDNGLILLISQADRKIRIEVGYGLEGVIPDGKAGAIIRDEISPRFKAGDYNGGITAGLNALVTAITPDYTFAPEVAAPAQHNRGGASPGSFIVALFIIGFSILGNLFGARNQRRRYRGGFSEPTFWGGGYSGGGGGFSGGSSGGGFSGGGGSFGGGGSSGGW